MSHLSKDPLRIAVAVKRAHEAIEIYRAGIQSHRSLCPDCERHYTEEPGSSVMCLKCGAWMVTETLPDD